MNDSTNRYKNQKRNRKQNCRNKGMRILHDKNIEKFFHNLAFDDHYKDSKLCDGLASTRRAFIPMKLIRRINFNQQEKSDASVREETLNRVITTCHEITAMRAMFGIPPDDTSSSIFSQHVRAKPRGNVSIKKKKDKVRLFTRNNHHKTVITVTDTVTDVTENVANVTTNVGLELGSGLGSPKSMISMKSIISMKSMNSMSSMNENNIDEINNGKTMAKSGRNNGNTLMNFPSKSAELEIRNPNVQIRVDSGTKTAVEKLRARSFSKNEINGKTMVYNGRNNGNNNGKHNNKSKPWQLHTIVSNMKENVTAITENVTNKLKTSNCRARKLLFLARKCDEINDGEINNSESKNIEKKNTEIHIDNKDINKDDGSSVPELVTRYTHDGDSTVSTSNSVIEDEFDIDNESAVPELERRYDTTEDKVKISNKSNTTPTINVTATRMRGGYDSDSSLNTDSISQHSNNDGVESTVDTITLSDEHERRNEASNIDTIPSTINITVSDATTRPGYRLRVDNHTIVTQINDSTNKRQYYTPEQDGDNTIYHVNHADAIGGNLVTEKQEGHIRISGCNPNGIKAQNLQSHLQHSKDLDIDIQGYSEVNTNFVLNKTAQAFYEMPKRMDPTSRPTWCSSDYESEGVFKPGGTGIVTSGSPASRIKETKKDPLGRWTCQILD